MKVVCVHEFMHKNMPHMILNQKQKPFDGFYSRNHGNETNINVYYIFICVCVCVGYFIKIDVVIIIIVI